MSVLLSPDEESLAIIEVGQISLTVVPTAVTNKGQHWSFNSTVVQQTKAQTIEPDLLTAVCWSQDSSTIIVAGSSGSLYTLDRCVGSVTGRMLHGQRLHDRMQVPHDMHGSVLHA